LISRRRSLLIADTAFFASGFDYFSLFRLFIIF